MFSNNDNVYIWIRECNERCLGYCKPLVSDLILLSVASAARGWRCCGSNVRWTMHCVGNTSGSRYGELTERNVASKNFRCGSDVSQRRESIYRALVGS